MNLQQQQKNNMMSFAWVNPKELYILDAFPEVIMIDTKEKNNERRPLLTAGAKDSNGNNGLVWYSLD